MSPNCKAKALYVKTSVIQCGVPDYHGDILNAASIKNIFTSFNNQNRFDLHHNMLPIDDVSLLENYISKSDEEIAGTIVPTGSWNVVLRVDNPEVQAKILDGEIQGVSLTTAIKDTCSAGLTNSIVTYSEVPDADCWRPIYISLVSDPANLVGLHVMDYDAYIIKSKKVNVHKFGGKTLSFLDKVKKLIAEEEASPSEPVIEKSTGADEEVEVEASVDEKKEEEAPVVEKATDEEEDEVVVEETTTTTEEEEEVIEKATDDESEAEEEEVVVEDEAEAVEDIDARFKALETRISELEALINKAEPTTEDAPVEATTEDKKDDEPVITKSAKIEVTNTETNTTSNFYEMSGRDPVTGKKIRNKTKILN